MGRVGTVTATWHPAMERFLIAVTTPTFLPSTVGPYDTYVLETKSLTAGPFKVLPPSLSLSVSLPLPLSLSHCASHCVCVCVCVCVCGVRACIKLVSYLPKFGQQAYFVSFPSRFLGPAKQAMMAFSANFDCTGP